MTAGPPASVILNCYNHQDYVGEAIESVLRQTHRDLELIIIDNGSTDGTRKVIEGFTDERIRQFLHDENVSLSRRLNEGLAAARGEFISVLYSDDWMLPDKLERQVAIFRTLGPEFGIVYSPALGFNQQTGRQWQHPSMAKQNATLTTLLRHQFDGAIDMSSPLMRRECAQRYGWHDDLFSDGEGMILRIAMRWKLHFDPKPTIVLRDHGANMGKAVLRNHDILMVILDRLQAHADFPDDSVEALKTFRAEACYMNAWATLRARGPARWARTQLRRAITLRPRLLVKPRMLAAMGLAIVPESVRARLNGLGDRLTDRPENRTFVERY